MQYDFLIYIIRHTKSKITWLIYTFYLIILWFLFSIYKMNQIHKQVFIIIDNDNKAIEYVSWSKKEVCTQLLSFFSKIRRKKERKNDKANTMRF